MCSSAFLWPEKVNNFGCTPFKRRLLSLLRNLHAPSRGQEFKRPSRRKLVPFVATHVSAPKKMSRMDWTTWSANRVPLFFINVTRTSIRMETTTRREHLVQENFCLQHKQLQKCWRRLRVRQSCFEVGQKMVMALSVWAAALQFESTCVVRLVRHAEELGAVSRSCGANILFCSLRENRTQNMGRTETCGMKKYIVDRSV